MITRVPIAIARIMRSSADVSYLLGVGRRTVFTVASIIASTTLTSIIASMTTTLVAVSVAVSVTVPVTVSVGIGA